MCCAGPVTAMLALNDHDMTYHCRCIKKGECYKPTCRFGQFNEATGYCPTKHSSEEVNSGNPDNSRHGSPEIHMTPEEEARRRTNLSGKR